MKPLLLMDVDGPLSPFGATWFDHAEAEDGYSFHWLTVSSGNTYRVALNPAHGAALRGLCSSYDLAWATTWQQDANRLISPILDLPEDLPVVPLQHWFSTGMHSWKTDEVAAWVGDRPFAWFDDEANRETRFRLRRMSWLGRHLVLEANPRTGLTQGDFAALAAFAETG